MDTDANSEQQQNSSSSQQTKLATAHHRDHVRDHFLNPKHKHRRLLGALLVIIVLVGGGLCSSYFVMHGSHVNENKNINSNEYQALFLTNGQVYFGKLSDLNNRYVSMTDIYYLQVQQSQSQQSVQPAATSTNQSQVSLAKLGNELHGPEDKMFISQNQVLFWENLKNTGKVVQAIKVYQSQN